MSTTKSLFMLYVDPFTKKAMLHFSRCSYFRLHEKKSQKVSIIDENTSDLKLQRIIQIIADQKTRSGWFVLSFKKDKLKLIKKRKRILFLLKEKGFKIFRCRCCREVDLDRLNSLLQSRERNRVLLLQ